MESKENIYSCKLCGEDKNSGRSTQRGIEEKKQLSKRLNIIEGQVRGINQMVLNDRYCDDILIQISAVIKSLKSVENNILESHLRNCVVRDIKSGNEDIINEVIKFIKKMQ